MADEYQIDLQKANAALKEMMGTVNFLKTGMKDLSTQIAATAKSNKKDFDDQTKSVGDYADTLEKKGVKSLKEFRKEQREQNYIIRESRQALMGMTFALAFLTQGQDGAKSSIKLFSNGLLAGVASMEATEFALFSLGRAGASMGGSLGKALMTISSFAGPIGVVIGVGAGLIAFFNQSAEAAKKNREEIEKLNTAIYGEPPYGKQRLALEGDIAVAEKDLYSAILERNKYGSSDIFGITESRVTDAELKVKQLYERLIKLDEKQGKTVQKTSEDAIDRIHEDALAEAEKFKAEDEYLKEYYDHQNDYQRKKQAAEDKYWDEQADNYDTYSAQMQALDEKIEENEKRKQDAIEKRIRKEEELHRRYIEGLSSGLNALAMGLSSLGLGTDTLIQKLIMAVQYALQIAELARQSQSIHATGTEGLGIAGTILSILGLGYAGGGYTGSGARYQPAGVVHKGEYVFDKTSVDRAGVDVLRSLHLSLQGYAAGGHVGYRSLSIGDSSSVISELRALRADIVELRSNPPQVHLHNLVSFRDALKKGMPVYELFDAKKKT